MNVSFTIANLVGVPRASSRIAPTHNFIDDLTWNKGKHKVQAGVNFRLITNDRFDMNNYPSYSYSRNTMKGLGADITAAVTAAMRAKYGNSALRLSEGTQLTNAIGTLLGTINSYNVRYNYGRDGQVAMGSQYPSVARFCAVSAQRNTSSTSRTRIECVAT